ncbi:MAG: T9SS type A sorting domain-containing protein [Flavobacteriaceae bacterium]|nr:T9SS type A sorting domain-containing protein [Flavobacteriaceae bacterium]
MKRKTTLALTLLFFFPVIWLNAKNSHPVVKSELIVAPPSNDDCDAATTITVNDNYLCGTVTAGTLSEATASSQATTGCTISSDKANDDVWFKFVATNTSHRIQLQNIVGNQTNLYHMIYNGGTSGSCSSMSLIYCSDPETSNLSGLTVGNTYFIRVFSNSSAAGANTTFDICVGTEPSSPVNDDCVNALAINTFPFTQIYDATGATNNNGFIAASGTCIAMNDGVWFTVTGTGDRFNLLLTPVAWNGAIAVYTGSCGALTCVGTKNAGGIGVVEGYSFDSTLGTTYYINIGYPSGTFDGAEGIFTLGVTLTALSVDEIIAKGFTYYPNPVTGGVLKMSASEPINNINVYTVLGREIRNIKNTDLSYDLDLTDLPAGAYYVRATVGSKSGTFKIIKQ